MQLIAIFNASLNPPCRRHLLSTSFFCSALFKSYRIRRKHLGWLRIREIANYFAILCRTVNWWCHICVYRFCRFFGLEDNFMRFILILQNRRHKRLGFDWRFSCWRSCFGRRRRLLLLDGLWFARILLNFYLGWFRVDQMHHWLRLYNLPIFGLFLRPLKRLRCLLGVPLMSLVTRIILIIRLS